MSTAFRKTKFLMFIMSFYFIAFQSTKAEPILPLPPPPINIQSMHLNQNQVLENKENARNSEKDKSVETEDTEKDDLIEKSKLLEKKAKTTEKDRPIDTITETLVSKESEIEIRYNNLYKEIIKDKRIKQFGYDFFRTTPKFTSPVPDDYVLGVGDKIKVYLWGDPVDMMLMKSEIDLSVSRDGTVYVPHVGVVPVAGMKISDFKKYLSSKLSSKFKNLKVDVVLTKLRTFNVYITGFVNKPGMISVDSLDTLMSALTRVGGVSKAGSLRRIEIRRNENGRLKVIDIDLYDLFIKGLPVDIILRDGDVVYVYPIGDVVAIFGDVKRPGIYEMKNEKELRDIVDFAGGFNPSVSDIVVRIFRYSKDGVEILEGNLGDEKFMTTKIINGDFIFFGQKPDVFENAISISGSVYYPGFYSIKDTKTLRDLLVKSKPKENAHFVKLVRIDKRSFGFKLENILDGSSNLELEPKDRVFVYEKYDFEPIFISGEVQENVTVPFYEGIKLIDVFNVVKLSASAKELKVNVYRQGSLFKVVYLNDLLIKNDLNQNIELKPGDVLIVKRLDNVEKAPSVTVIGEVRHPGKYILQDGMRLSDIIEKAGGYTPYAYPKALILIRESARKLQLERIELTFTTLKEEFLKESQKISLGATPEEREAVLTSIERQRQALEILRKKAEFGLGRISLEIPDTLDELKRSNQNIELEDGDIIIVPRKPNYILVLGDVYNQIILPYIKGYKLRDYIFMIGGYRRSADRSGIHVIKANGRVVSPETYGRKFLIGSSIEDYELSEGDTIVVPSEIRVPVMWRPLIKDIVQIIFQAISTAVLAKRL